MNVPTRFLGRARVLTLSAVTAGVVAMTALGGERAAEAQPITGLPITQLPHMCRTVAPDAVLHVPVNFGSENFPSGSGEYFYRKAPAGYNAQPCNYWVVDVKMAPSSNTAGNPNNKQPVIVNGEAFDLPSSSVADAGTQTSTSGNALPNNAVDCNQFDEYLLFYRKLHNESEFKPMGWRTRHYGWSNGQCTVASMVGPMAELKAEHPPSGWNTYRVAVSAKLRSSGQEVRATVRQAPPE